MNNINNFTHASQIKIIFLDFDGVFTDNSVLLDENGIEYVTCSRYDGFGLKALENIGIRAVILTTETKPLARRRAEKLNLECYDCITDKLAFALQYVHNLSITLDQVAFMGNDINDLPLLENVSFPIVTPDSHASVHCDSFFVTRSKGGKGCIREVADFFALHGNKSLNNRLNHE